jgi:hypothetical protein
MFDNREQCYTIRVFVDGELFTLKNRDISNYGVYLSDDEARFLYHSIVSLWDCAKFAHMFQEA